MSYVLNIMAALARQQSAAPAIAFAASPYDGWNAVETSADDSVVQVAHTAFATGAASSQRRIGFALDNTAGKTPEIRLANTPAYRAQENPTTAYFLCWSDDPDGDTWTSLGAGTVSGSNRLFSTTALPAGPVYFQTMPCASVAAMQAQVDAWVADALTTPTPSAVSGYVIGTLAATTWDGVAVPELPMRAFRFGTGSRQMVLTGCVHPDEAPAFWGMRAAIDWALGSSAEAIAFRSRWTVTVYPECNLQGAWAGRTRAGTDDEDMNRGWDILPLEPAKAILQAAFSADLTAFQSWVDFHGSGGLGGSHRDVWRIINESNAGAVTAFDAEMNLRGAYVAVDANTTTPRSITAWPANEFPGSDRLMLIYEAKANRDVGPVDWAALGVDVIEAIHTIQPAIWPDTAPWILADGVWNDAGIWDDGASWVDGMGALAVTPTSDGFTVENIPLLSPLTTITPTSDGFTAET